MHRSAPSSVSQWVVPTFLVLLLFANTEHLAAAPPDPRTPGPFSTGVTDIDEGCSYDLDGVSLTWSDSPFGYPPTTVVFGDHDFGGSDSRCPGSPAELVDMKARVHYPRDPSLPNIHAVAPGGPFPLVVFLHGQQIWSIPGYEGYDYVASLLASHGFIVASIDGRSLLDSTIKSRGEHIREHLRRFVVRNQAGSGSFLSGKLDMSKVALVGHSRGGDSVAAAWEWQRVAPDPGYAITAVIAIAPVQFFGRLSAEPSFISHLRDVAYQILHGSHDCDVSDFQGLRQYDRAADIRAVGDTPKSMVFIKDANHNFFNTVWEEFEGSECGGGKVLPGEVARDLAKVYMHSFLQTVVKGNREYRGYLTGEIPNPVTGTEAVLDFQAPGPEFIALDHFEELPGVPHDKLVNSQGGAVDTTELTYDESRFSATAPNPFNSYKGETYGGWMKWTAPVPSYRSDVTPAGAPDPAVLDHLSFRTGIIYGGLAPNANMTFRVRLRDAGGTTSTAVAVRDFASIPFPYPALVGGTKTVMGVVRIPLAAFTGIDPTAIREVELLFDDVRPGEIVVDDIRFTK